MRCNHTREPDIFTATAVLHNVCIRFNPSSPCLAEYAAETYSVAMTKDLSDVVEYRPGSDYVLRGNEVRDILATRFSSWIRGTQSILSY